MSDAGMNGAAERELRHASVQCEYKALDAGPVGRFSGYASVFNEVDSYGDKVLPGAFADSIARAAKAGRMPAMLWQHDPCEVIGIWQVMREDARGLYVEGQIADTSDGQEAYTLLKMGALSGLSIGFTTVEEQWNKVDGVREITAVDLWEVSLVTFPANLSARVEDVKHSGGAMSIRQFEKFLRDEGRFSATQAKAIASRGFKALRDAGAEDVDDDWIKAMAARFRA